MPSDTACQQMISEIYLQQIARNNAQ